MEFNPHKCEVLNITRKRNPLMFSCTLHNKELNTTNVEYIGVTISNDLNRSNSSHTNNIIAKKQTTHYDSSKETLRPATTTYLLSLVDVFFNRQSAFLWVQTVLLFYPTCSFICTRQTSYRGVLRKTKRS